MSRAVIFDVDGVLINGYHSNPARVRAWDKDMLADTGVDPDQFRKGFTFEVFVKKVIVGQMSFVDALDRYLPSVGYKKGGMAFAHYGPQAESPLFFDDTPKVVEAARRHGWEAVEFDTLADCATHPWIADRVGN